MVNGYLEKKERDYWNVGMMEEGHISHRGHSVFEIIIFFLCAL